MSPPAERRAVATAALLAGCVGLYGAACAAGADWLEPAVADMLAWGATYGPRTAGGEPWRLFTSLFVHAGLVHLALNMWVLWDVGRFVERRIGAGYFLLAYLAAGFCGGVASLAWNPHLTAVGASGAIFGLYGLVLGWLARAPGQVAGGSWKGLARNALFFVIANLAFGAANPQIDNAAHLGGLAGGLGIGLALGPAQLAERALLRRSAGAIQGAALAMGTWAVAALWPAPPDFQAQLDRFNALATRTFATLEEIGAERRGSAHLRMRRTRAVLAGVLPEWHEIRMTLAEYGTPPRGREQVVTAVVESMVAMEEGWRLFLEAADERDDARARRLLERSIARRRAAVAALRRLPER
ncbi:MAG: rhomboid family intramembrane serine protease [Candidatus Sericytochromatia bacterium]|nr:rhomboid family intramembrane serine protease [Candidatus Tanganyikabacteria bacterium]